MLFDWNCRLLIMANRKNFSIIISIFIIAIILHTYSEHGVEMEEHSLAIQNEIKTIRFESIERFLLSGQNYDLFVISMIRIENKKRKTNGN